MQTVWRDRDLEVCGLDIRVLRGHLFVSFFKETGIAETGWSQMQIDILIANERCELLPLTEYKSQRHQAWKHLNRWVYSTNQTNRFWVFHAHQSTFKDFLWDSELYGPWNHSEARISRHASRRLSTGSPSIHDAVWKIPIHFPTKPWAL